MFPIVQLSQFEIPTFFLVLSTTAILILILIRTRASRWYKNYYWLPSHFQGAIWSLTLLIFIGGFLGGRLGHILIEEPRYYYESPVHVFFVWQGGFVFFGGFLFAALLCGVYLYGKRIAQPWLYFDFFAPLISLSYIIGRLGCFLNGCCYGKVCELPWAFMMKDEAGLVALRHPTQIYSLLLESIVLVCILTWEKRKSFYMNKLAPAREKKLGLLFAVWLVLHSMGRLLTEFWRDDFRGPHYLLSPSSWISLALIFLAWLLIWKRTAKT